jgi:HAD superfamily hydrolase (TIGR01509 family)
LSGAAAQLLGRRVDAVLFDYGLTLVTFVRPEKALRAAYTEVAARLEAAAVGRVPPVGRLLRDVHDRVEAEVAAHEATGSLRELDIAVIEAVAYADLGLRPGADLLDGCAELVQRAWWEGVAVAPGSIATLHRLRERGLRVGLCSNAPYRPASMRAQLEHLGLRAHLDAATFSSEVGWRKPAGPLFRAAAAALGVGPARCLMVGDRRREDVSGGRAVGMATVRLREHHDDAGADDADVILDRLADLPDLLCANNERRRRGSVDNNREAPWVGDQTGSVMKDVDFREYLKARCRERGISLHRLALLCDLNQIYFYQAVNKNKDNPPPWVLRRAAPHLGVTYVDLLMAAGYLDETEVKEWESRSEANLAGARG